MKYIFKKEGEKPCGTDWTREATSLQGYLNCVKEGGGKKMAQNKLLRTMGKKRLRHTKE